MIVIVDYGMGNLKSVQKALNFLGIQSEISSEGERISKGDGIIIPGVGAFPDAMKNMRDRGLVDVIKKEALKGKPILGICLGMQLLFEESEEIELCEGLGLLKGKIKKIEDEVKIPHMGWNNLRFNRDCVLFNGLKDEAFAYFVHSYYAEVEDEDVLKAYTLYGSRIPAVVSKGMVFGTQFHPEKSGDAGMKMLKNFGELIK